MKRSGFVSVFLRLSFFPCLISWASAAVPAFEAGDRVVFIGDSITHSGRYHADVYLFYATRFPAKPFTAFNCGISGDTAPGTLSRFPNDIAVHQPNVATIMLGMNDAWGWMFEPSQPIEAQRKAQENSYNTYTQAMDQLAAKLRAADCRLVFIKPSIYDQTAQLDTKNLRGKNNQLRRFAEYIDTLAENVSGSVVDFHNPMGILNHTLQATNPSATIVGKDRVHPGVPGHFVMTYLFLKAQNMPQYVSAIRLNAEGDGEVVEQRNCRVHDSPVVKPGSLSFTATEAALPFPLGEAQAPALDWVPFQQDLNRQVLAVDNLPTGNYELRIDDFQIGHYSHEALKAGIELSATASTPQYQQALAVKALHEKHLHAAGKLRAMAFVRHSMLRKIAPPVSEADPDALAAALATELEKSRGKAWYDYLRQQADAFLEALPHEADYQRQAIHWMKQMWIANQPRSHQWRLTRLSDGPPGAPF